jgi:hypothetical protein
MLRKIAAVALVALTGYVSTGCVSYAGSTPVPTDTLTIVLKENDFKTVKTHLTGSAECTYLFGAIPFDDPNILSKSEAQIRDQAAMDGRAVQLVNWTKDEVIQNFIIIKKHKLMLTADAIEFTKN